MSLSHGLEPPGAQFKTIPVDILSFIVSYLDWWSIMDLWCCGDRMLHRRMKNHGVAQFEVKIREITPVSPFPLGWRFFDGLSSLSLCLASLNPTDIDFIRAGVQSTSSTLRKLRLQFPDAELVLLDPNALQPGSYSRNQVEECSSSSSTAPRLWCASHQLPNLTFLEVNSGMRLGRLCNADFALLPRSLTDLRVVTNRNQLTTEVMTYLGPEITHLSISFKPMESGVISLPPQLQSLQIVSDIAGSLNGLVPSNLTHFHAYHWTLKVFHLVYLPSCTKSLDLALDIGEELNFQLPKGITALTLSGHGSNILQTENFLPPALVRLTCHYEVQLSHFYWPKALTYLELREAFITTDMEALPASLTLLNLDGSLDANYASLSYEALMKAIPSTILELLLNINGGVHHFEFPSSKFPVLDHLVLYGPFICSQELLKGLSRKLKRFTMQQSGHYDYGDDENVLALLPRSIQELNLSVTRIYRPTCFQFLPPALTRLDLNITGTATANDLRMLPRSLTDLILHFLELIERNALTELPDTLRTLHLGASISEIDFSRLPPKLSHFIAPKATLILSQAEKDSIPRNIKRLLLGQVLIWES